MADDKSLKLNTISRFRKQSERLVLETHSSCEVPAGCGGIILRWNNPDEKVLVSFVLWTSSKREVFLDGNLVHHRRTAISHGEHLLCIKLEASDSAAAIIVGTETDQRRLGISPSRDVKIDLVLATTQDGTWLATCTEPSAEWKSLNYNDSEWSPMKEFGYFSSAGSPRTNDRYQYDSAKRLGGKSLGLGKNTGPMWIRKKFVCKLQKDHPKE